MLDLKKIDLGKDDAESDEKLKEYFVKTTIYEKALSGDKTLITGRKGSGKSAIFRQIDEKLSSQGELVIRITPDQYSWLALKDYKEQGISPQQAHTNAWKLTLLSAIVWELNNNRIISENSLLKKYFEYLKDNYVPKGDNLLINLIEKAKKNLKGIQTQWLSFTETSSIATPLRIVEEIKNLLIEEDSELGGKVRIIIDKLDDGWDGTEESKNLLIGLIKASNELNSVNLFKNIRFSVFLRSDIYEDLFFDDQDKIRQNRINLIWDFESLKRIIAERVRFSLNLKELDYSDEKIWNELFSEKVFRSRAKADKFIIDRTFKRPRDMLSLVRFCIAQAINNNHTIIEKNDTKSAVEEDYSKSKYEDLIIEYKKQVPYIKDLLDSFLGKSHKISQEEMISNIKEFLKSRNDSETNPLNILELLFIMGFIGIKKRGQAGVKQRGGIRFYYYYDDSSIKPISFKEYYIHPSLRYTLSITESRNG